MHVNAVTLDTDRVLVNVADSYRRAIVESVDRHYGTAISRDKVQLLKDAGGFNNNWELTYATALPVLATREADLSVAVFIDEIEVRGGDLDTAKATVEVLLPESSVAFDEWDLGAPRETFRTLYLGSDLYRDLENGDPPFEAPGHIHDEPVFFRPETLDVLGDRELGVVTGRPAAETDITLDRVTLDVVDDHRSAMDDWGEDRPHPAVLVIVAERLGADSVVLVGDTPGSMKMALNADAADLERVYYGVGALSGGPTGDDNRQKFSEIGTAVVVEDVNEVPDLLD